MHPFHHPVRLLRWLLFCIPLLCLSCSSQENNRRHNLHGEHLYRHHNEYAFIPPTSQPYVRPFYPWEENYIGSLPRITKEFFRCKGNPVNPPRPAQERSESKPVPLCRDCQGGKKHGLPLRDSKEFIYPCLLEILNYLQEKTGKRLVITCGHRCPAHNLYADARKENQSSKHMLGAEVDFYVEGMQQKPLEIVALIQKYYTETPPFKEQNDFTRFVRYEKEGLNVQTPPWYNKEIFIKLYLPHEGRDGDNLHPYPYLSIQLRYDRTLKQRLLFDASQAQNYLRH